MSCVDLQKVLNIPGKDDCFSKSSSAKEKGKKFIFQNLLNKSICRVKIDDCLITNPELKKCDFLFKVLENNKYYLVELKGVAVIDAVAQILSTYHIINIKIQTKPENYKGIVVSSSVPSATEQRFRRLQDKCYRENRLAITKTHVLHSEII
jgi:hypothetical protein